MVVLSLLPINVRFIMPRWRINYPGWSRGQAGVVCFWGGAERRSQRSKIVRTPPTDRPRRPPGSSIDLHHHHHMHGRERGPGYGHAHENTCGKDPARDNAQCYDFRNYITSRPESHGRSGHNYKLPALPCPALFALLPPSFPKRSAEKNKLQKTVFLASKWTLERLETETKSQ